MAKADQQSFDVVIVGAGFSGLYMLHKLRQLGLTARVFEAGDGVGGTWYWNRYPGARVDVESQEYSYSFDEALQDDWVWTERYSTQPELLRYINHVADRFELRRDVQLETRVQSATYDEASALWTVRTDRGEVVSARYCIMATGCLSVPNEPNFPGQDQFKGPTYHTGRWPHEGVDFTGKRVAVIGTGSSAIQSIPQIAAQADHIYVLQRTPNYSVPAHNAPIDPAALADWNANRAARRQAQRTSASGIYAADPTEILAMEVSAEERQARYEERWAKGGFCIGATFADMGIDKVANDTAAVFVADKIRSMVKDPKVAEALVPKDYPFGAKRLCVDTGYYETFNRGNVSLIDLNASPLDSITAKGVQVGGEEIAVDAIVFAIGFDAMTGALSRIQIQGKGGQALSEVWEAGPRSYLGLMVAGFPNLFTVTGPGSPSVLSNMLVSIEQHVEWISDCIGHLQDRQLASIEAMPDAQDAWVDHVNEVANMTLHVQASSWYLGANIPGKPRVFMPYIGGVGLYREKCDDVAAKGYEGFALKSAAAVG